MKVFKKSYHTSATGEIIYRPERKIPSIQEILKDTIATGLIIAKREFHAVDDEDSKAKFAEINMGIKQFDNYVFEGNFRIDHAQVASAKAAYLAAIILTDHTAKPELFDEKISTQEYLITHPDYNFLNKRLKFIGKGEALFYWNRAIKLLQPEYFTAPAPSSPDDKPSAPYTSSPAPPR
jgi:hypothetical protein